MIGRRHAVIGLACLAASAAAAALKPRRRLSLAGSKKLEEIIPTTFRGWSERPTDALVTPDDEDSLATQLYSQIVGRLYVNGSGAMVMLLIAYGDTQNDLLQLHRPEVCYPAFGFRVDASTKTPVPLTPEVSIPARALTATSQQRVEQILYWTRIGEHLPTDGREQRMAKLSDQFAGVVADGILVRVSTVTDDPGEGLAINSRFARDLLSVIPEADRPMLIGTAASARLPAPRST